MNSSQMLITVGAMLLLSLVILRVNNSFLSTSDVLLNSKYNVVAISLAASMIEEANGKAFDHNTEASPVNNLASLTPSDSLGPESGEDRYTFNDFDDFNGFAILDTFVVDSLLLGVFNISCQVNYITAASPNTDAGTATWNKSLSVLVTSSSMTDTVSMSTIYSYWNFR